MKNMLEHLKTKFNLDLTKRSPIEIPDFGRLQLADLFCELGFRVGVEVGVATGEYSSILMTANPNLRLFGVDPYEPHQGYRDYTSHRTFDGLEAEAHNQLDKYPSYTFIRKMSMDALVDFEDRSLDFVYIDADHCFESVVNDIAGWSKKIRKGGIISGHDYAKTTGNANMHVVQAVNGYTDAWGIKPWFLLGNRANDEGLIRDASRSWLWVV